MLHFCRVSNYIMKLSAVRKVLETPLFLALGSFETLGSKLSHGTSWIAEIIHWIISPNVRPQGRQESLAIFPHACLGRYVWLESHVSLDQLGKLIL